MLWCFVWWKDLDWAQKTDIFSPPTEQQDQAPHPAIDYWHYTSTLVRWARIGQRLNFCPHTEALYVSEEAPSLSMQVYTKSRERLKEISKMPSLQRTPITETHLILSVVTQHLQGNLGLSKVHPNPYLFQLLPTLYLATLQTNEAFAWNMWKGARVDLKRELGSPALSSSLLSFSPPEHFVLSVHSQSNMGTEGGVTVCSCRSWSSAVVLSEGHQPGLQDPQADQYLQGEKLVLTCYPLYWVHRTCEKSLKLQGNHPTYSS